ncbi:MAG: PQQ-binding-like beta-propeller repeat protein, partial [Saprospiraceae bacterium]|nr:PQQ-binding-like beta-propeller repeat protein [Saprospiraceae bacterium]
MKILSVIGKSILGLLILAMVACQGERNSVDIQHGTWWEYGGGPDQSKFVVQDEITKENVSQMEIKWQYQTGDNRPYQFSPIIVDSIMYVLAKESSLVALNATTGEELWIHANLRGITRRGINYWENSDRSDRRILFAMNHTLQAIDAITGKSILTFGDNGIVDLKVGLDRDPALVSRAQSNTPGRIFEDLILLGSSPGEGYMSPPGHLRAYNVVTGEHVWTFRTIPHPGEFGYETWPKDAYLYVGGANTWGEISLDKDRGIAYFPTGSPTYDYYGADRLGSNLFANCILALDARTGIRLWHYQLVHHDLWDYDLTAAPQLTTIQHEGKEMDVVAVATKQGFLYVFDRVTGEPVWPIEERPVPPSEMPGEETWPTQPFPTVLPPFTRQTVNPEDITTLLFTEQERAEWQQRVAKARKGLFNPITTEETIGMPGAVGGANWGNTAANPTNGLVFVMSQEYPSFYKLEQRPPVFSRGLKPSEVDSMAVTRGQLAYNKFCMSCHGADRAGNALGPSLLGLAMMNLPYLSQIITHGIGRMPPVLHIEEDDITDILAFFGGSMTDPNSEELDLTEGNVVASGGAPRKRSITSPYNTRGRDYPPGIEVPQARYYTG